MIKIRSPHTAGTIPFEENPFLCIANRLTLLVGLYYNFLKSAGIKEWGVTMKISSKLLFSFLCEHYPTARLGRSVNIDDLPLPIFYDRTKEPEANKVYIARTQDLPQRVTVRCIFIGIGSRPSRIWNNWQGCVFHIDRSDLELFSLINTVIGYFDSIYRWEHCLQELIDSNAEIEEFVRASIPIFGNCITITDFELRILVNCDVVEVNEKQIISISNKYDRIPDSVSLTLIPTFKEKRKLREPFSYKGQQNNSEGDNYCINLFLGDSYLGTCTLWNTLKPMQESDYILFQEFSQYIQRVLSAQSRPLSNQMVTMKNIFADLLNSFPVSNEDLNRAMHLLKQNLEFRKESIGGWQCLVIGSANRSKTLPGGYICTSIENMLPNATAISFEDLIVCFCMQPERDMDGNQISELLGLYMQDMNFRVGISGIFYDIFKARNYYLQAKAIFELGIHFSAEQYVYRFEDYILLYMLHQCTGEFSRDMILTPGMRKLKEKEGGVDYWETLRLYLDNECNASKTAQDLFLHRSSLLPRLEKIKSLVSMDTPEQRLYLRICMAISDLLETKS